MWLERYSKIDFCVFGKFPINTPVNTQLLQGLDGHDPYPLSGPGDSSPPCLVANPITLTEVPLNVPLGHPWICRIYEQARTT